MTAAAAPFYHDVAEAPAGVLCDWLTADDGVRLRATLWRDGERGTVLLFAGRSEYAEKYGPAAGELARRGFATATVDWRGQGLSDRPLHDPMTGHVARFTDYQRDVAALLAWATALELPQPFYLLAHSMGGQIGLRSLHQGLPVRAAAFSAPMWGLRLHPALRPAAWVISAVSRPARRGHLYAPGTSATTYVAEAPFADNVLTRDAGMYAFMQRHVQAHPDLALGGPSLHWVHEALLDCQRLQRLPSPPVPCYTALGSAERVVDAAAIHDRMGRWPGGRLDLCAGAEHEIMMERPDVRTGFYDRVAAHFAANA